MGLTVHNSLPPEWWELAALVDADGLYTGFDEGRIAELWENVNIAESELDARLEAVVRQLYSMSDSPITAKLTAKVEACGGLAALTAAQNEWRSVAETASGHVRALDPKLFEEAGHDC